MHIRNVTSKLRLCAGVFVALVKIRHSLTVIPSLLLLERELRPFEGTQKIRQFVFFNNTLQCRRLSCIDCEENCTHYHLGYFQQHQKNDTIDLENEGSTVVSDSDKIATIGDYVLIKWVTAKNPGEVLSVFEDGLMVRCMKQGLKFWRWPNIKDEQLYSWKDVIQKIKTPKLVKRGNYVITELDDFTSDVKIKTE